MKVLESFILNWDQNLTTKSGKYVITARVEDSGGLFSIGNFIIDVIDENDSQSC